MVRCENGLVIAPTRPRARDLVPLDHQRLADMSLGNDEIVDVEIVIVLRIGDRRFQALAHVAGDALAREFEIGERGRYFLAANELRQQIELLRADPQHAGNRLGLVVGERALALFLAHRCSPGLTMPRPPPRQPARAALAPTLAAAARLALRSDEWP